MRKRIKKMRYWRHASTAQCLWGFERSPSKKSCTAICLCFYFPIKKLLWGILCLPRRCVPKGNYVIKMPFWKMYYLNKKHLRRNFITDTWAFIRAPNQSRIDCLGNNKALSTKEIASYFHKGLMWRGVKVEISRINGSGYNKSIFSKVLWIKNFSIINGIKMTS